jgi:glutamate 5-kinase
VVLLSDTDGFILRGPAQRPSATLIPLVEDVDAVWISREAPCLRQGRYDNNVHDAKKVCAEGIDMAIINGADPFCFMT